MGKALKILQINTYDKWGGAEKVALQLHHAYLKAGHHAYIGVKQSFLPNEKNILSLTNSLSRDPEQKITSHVKKKLGWLKPTLERIPRWQGFHYGLYQFMGSAGWQAKKRSLSQWLRGHEFFDYPHSGQFLERLDFIPDIIHCHNLHGSYFDLRVLAKWSKHIPVFLTLHDQWTFTGHCAHSFQCEAWQNGCGSCPSLDSYPPLFRDGSRYNWQQKKEIYQQSKLYVVTPSKWLMDCVQKSNLKPAIQVAKVIPNGIDLSLFQPGNQKKARQSLALPSDSLILLFAASSTRNHPYKDFKTLEAAVKLAAKKLSNILLIALGGHASDNTKQSYIDLGNARLLFFPFQTEPKKIAVFYQSADLYVHATKADTFPFVVIEALSCGLPVVASNLGGIPEQVQNGKTGYLVEKGNPQAMAAQIVSLLENPKQRQVISKDAAEYAKGKLTEEKMVKNYLDFYRQTLNVSSL